MTVTLSKRLALERRAARSCFMQHSSITVHTAEVTSDAIRSVTEGKKDGSSRCLWSTSRRGRGGTEKREDWSSRRRRRRKRRRREV